MTNEEKNVLVCDLMNGKKKSIANGCSIQSKRLYNKIEALSCRCKVVVYRFVFLVKLMKTAGKMQTGWKNRCEVAKCIVSPQLVCNIEPIKMLQMSTTLTFFMYSAKTCVLKVLKRQEKTRNCFTRN